MSQDDARHGEPPEDQSDAEELDDQDADPTLTAEQVDGDADRDQAEG